MTAKAAVTTRFTIVYVLVGMWYQMIAPVALGVAALFRVAFRGGQVRGPSSPVY